MKVVLATRNPGKIMEFSKLLKVEGIEFIPISDFNIEDVEETEKTFIGNSILKAKYAVDKTGLPAIADDSGMELTALNGFPGIYSARCAGENATDEEKRQFILEKMKGISDRRVLFVCAISFMRPGSDIPTYFEEICEGELLEEARGVAKPNIQYDSLFYYPEYGKTFAEISDEDKNKVSHRGKACKSMKKYLEEMVKSGKR